MFYYFIPNIKLWKLILFVILFKYIKINNKNNLWFIFIFFGHVIAVDLYNLERLPFQTSVFWNSLILSSSSSTLSLWRNQDLIQSLFLKFSAQQQVTSLMLSLIYLLNALSVIYVRAINICLSHKSWKFSPIFYFMGDSWGLSFRSIVFDCRWGC